MDTDQEQFWVHTVCLRGFKHFTSRQKHTSFVICALRVNKCEFSVYMVRILMKCTHVCAAKTTYFKLFTILYIEPDFPSKHVRFEAPQKTNTSVPSMFQGLLNVEGIWVQLKVSPDTFNLLL